MDGPESIWRKIQMGRILYVTSFSEKLYKESGRSLVESFLYSKSDGTMLVCYEGFNYDQNNPVELPSKKCRVAYPSKVKTYDMTKDKFMLKWLKKNADIIPKEMGGRATEESNPQSFLFWNFRASKWFRKIVCLKYAYEKYGHEYDMIVWVDCDCLFEKKVSEEFLESAFKNKYGLFYSWGKMRKQNDLGIETGFFGFNKHHHGYEILEEYIFKFSSGKIRKHKYWDDSHALGYVVNETSYPTIDLVTNYKLRIKQSRVIERGIFAEYVSHEKGKHKKVGLDK